MLFNLGAELMKILLKKITAAFTSLAILIMAAPGAYAQGIPGATYTVILPGAGFGSTNYTKVLVSNIAAARKFCAELGNESYNIDCLAERLGVISDDIPKGTDYDEVRSILKDTSKQLGKIARENRDPNQPRGRATRPGEDAETTTRPLTPVAPASLPSANAQAQAILDNTETLLLRSAAGSESKTLQYSRIADALGSTKVLLRSA